MACRILVSQPRIKPTAPCSGSTVLSIGPPRKSQPCIFYFSAFLSTPKFVLGDRKECPHAQATRLKCVARAVRIPNTFNKKYIPLIHYSQINDTVFGASISMYVGHVR